MASRISACTAEDQCRTSATKRPIWRPASGRRLGPSTISATTKMTRISAGPKELGMVRSLPATEFVERRPEAPNVVAQAAHRGPELSQAGQAHTKAFGRAHGAPAGNEERGR